MKKPQEKELIPKFSKQVEVSGKKYKLVHPGMRMHTRWRRDSTEIIGGKVVFNMETFLDNAFDCVEPIDHNYFPTMDNIVDPKDQEEWARLLPGFLRGASIEEFERKKKKETPEESG